MANLKITEVEVIDLAITKSESGSKFIRNMPLVGPMEPYEEYAKDRSMWTGGAHWIIPLVIIRTNEGIEGYGFCGGGSATAGKLMIDEHFSKILINSDPFDTESLWDKMFKATIVFGRKGAAIEAISGVDNALWDIKGKYLEMPVYKLLGGKTKPRIKLYASNLHPSDLENPDYGLLAKEALDYKKQGYLGMKQRPCAGPREGRKGMARNEMLVKTVREAVGDDIDIMMDAYMSWADVDYAVAMIRRLDKYNMAWIEEPLFPDDFSGYKYLRSKVQTPIAAGEHEFTRFGFKELFVNQVLDIVQPDIIRMGGITEAKKVIAMAEAFNVPIAPHIAYPEALQVIMSSPMVKWGEDPCIPTWEKNEKADGFSDAFLINNPKAENGFISLDENKPGLGFDLNWEAIERLKK